MSRTAAAIPSSRRWALVSTIVMGGLSAFAAETRVVDLAGGIPAASSTVFRQAVSGDGRYVAFTSDAGSIVSGVAGGLSRVYLRDMDTGITLLVSRDSLGGVPMLGAATAVSVSTDGRYVVFTCLEALTPNAPPGANEAVYLFDRVANSVECVSLSSTGAGARGTLSPRTLGTVVSSDGRYVLFESLEPLTLDAGVATDLSRVYRRDRVSQQTLLVSPANPDPPPGSPSMPSYAGGISANGSRVLYQVVGPYGFAQTPGIFVRDFTSGQTPKVDVDGQGNVLLGVLDSSLDWSEDGSRIVVSSMASNPTIGDAENAADVYAIDWLLPAAFLVSVNQAGQNGASAATAATISDDGRYVAFESSGNDLIAWDQSPGIVRDVVVRDLVAQRNFFVNVSSLGVQSNDSDAFDPRISGDGGSIVFVSASATLVPGATGAHYFHRDRIGFTKLGYGKPGSAHFTPQLNGSGSTAPGGSGTLFLSNGTVFSQSLLFVSLDRSYLAPISGPFKGTVLVTAAPILVLPIPIDAFGQFFVNYTLPVGLPFPPEVYLQCAMPDPLAINGVAVSSALLMGM